MERSDAPRVCQRPWGNHHDRYYSGDERGGGAFHTASKVLNSSNMATSDCRHRSNRDDRLDVSTGLWICQTSLSADLGDPAPGQMVSLAKSAKRPQGSTAIKPVEFPVRRTTCPAPFWPQLKGQHSLLTFALRYVAEPRFYPAQNAAAAIVLVSYVRNRTICT